jgi:hypothetical protein
LLRLHDVGDGHRHVERDLREVLKARGGFLLSDVELSLDVPSGPQHSWKGNQAVAQEKHQHEQPASIAYDNDGQEHGIPTRLYNSLSNEDPKEDEEDNEAGQRLNGD